MTASNARCTFLRSYLVPDSGALSRLVRGRGKSAPLSNLEGGTCIRNMKASHRWSGARVNFYGGTHKVVTDA
jgi:hypothetical protein